MPIVKLQSSDGEIIETDIATAKCSRTLKNMIEDLNIGDGAAPIPLSNVSADILRKVLVWCEYHKNDPEFIRERDPTRTDNIDDWDEQYYNVEQEILFEVMKAANYLNIPALLHTGVKTVANMMRDRTPEEIRAHFNIENDLTPEQEEEIRKEASYCEER